MRWLVSAEWEISARPCFSIWQPAQSSCGALRRRAGEARRIDDRRVRSTGERRTLGSFFHVQLPGTVAIFAADAQLAEGRVAVDAVAVRDRLGQAAVAHDATGGNYPAKTVIAKLVPRRQRPRARL